MSVWSTLLTLPAEFWTLARKVEALLKLQQETRETLDDMTDRIEQLERRMTYLEASQSQVITEAKAAAAAASTVLAGGILSDTVTRLTRLEIKLENMPADRPTLPPRPRPKASPENKSFLEIPQVNASKALSPSSGERVG